jgi:thymidylate synthase (FAD)
MIRKPTAKLSSITMPVDPELQGYTLGQLVAYYARVSNPENQHNTDTMPKLLNFLRNNKHWSPFDMVNIVVEVETTRTIGRQFLRHWTIKPQESSQRYANIFDTEPFYSEARITGTTNRQGSIKSDDETLNDWWAETQAIIWHNSIAAYDDAIAKGIATELARDLLPEGLTPTSMAFNGTLRSWIHYFEQRLDSHSQLEHQILAQAIYDCFVEYDPTLKDVL